MNNGQTVPHVQAPMGDRRPIDGGPTQALPVQQPPPPIYAAPVPPAQPTVQAQMPAPTVQAPPGDPPWARKPEVAPLVLPETVRFGIEGGLQAGATAEEILHWYGQSITYEQLVEFAKVRGLELRRAMQQPTPAQPTQPVVQGAPIPTLTPQQQQMQMQPAVPGAVSEPTHPLQAPPQETATRTRRDQIRKDEHYPKIALYIAKGVEDTALIARELNVTEKAVGKALAAIKKDPAKWGLNPRPGEAQTQAAPSQQTLPEIQAAPQPTPILEWVPQIGQVIPGTASALPNREICDRVRAVGYDIEWRREEKDGYVIIPGAAMRATQSQPAQPPSQLTTDERGEPVKTETVVTSRFDSAPHAGNMSAFDVGDSPMINRSLEILCAVHALARNAGYSFDEISGAAELLAASNASAA